MRQQGYYWVRRGGQWSIAKYYNDGKTSFFYWEGYSVPEYFFDEVGPEIEPPVWKN